MSEQEKQQITIARACGAKIGTKKFRTTRGLSTGYRWEWADGTPCSRQGGGMFGWGWNSEASVSELPDYPNDLNAMRSAEEHLKDKIDDGVYVERIEMEMGTRGRAAFSTAKQRASAMAKMLHAMYGE